MDSRAGCGGEEEGVKVEGGGVRAREAVKRSRRGRIWSKRGYGGGRARSEMGGGGIGGGGRPWAGVWFI